MTGSASKYLYILVELITIIFKSMSFFSCALMRTEYGRTYVGGLRKQKRRV